MRIIKRSVLVAFWQKHSKAKAGLLRWHKLTKAADWTDLDDTQATFSHADPVTVKSKRTVVVFNIAGNSYRLITAIHYNTHLVFTLMVLTHAEYDKDKWKDVL